ncbi:polysaccharide pyruvyl transferase family protein [Hyunsoonleella sp. SJ7]|uniref:Polysaccharide pyruvyl transferase family protein n=1 Tax=Hyunsoonleella aquatilis TaxID=2762758 RepID=A0A923H7W7_9FLAO|nr:polysaccharide pyruvyl transferase family protein [Hyunsoonleella aquatilis]MBC3758491.1 polysaccharide pyruvyl transferase family protein [Hyunsoonleella aquatilis]
MKKSTKVGILTFHYSNHNFGALLQTYAILNAVRTFGVEVKIIDFYPEKPKGIKHRLFDFIRFALGYNFTKFRKNYLDILATNDGLESLNNKLDTFIVGSDQVWRYRDNHNNLCRYYFDFVNKENKKIAYAASFGLETWHGDKLITQKIKDLVNRFDNISVREQSGVEICKDVFQVESTLVLDSTLLLDKSYYEKIINGKLKTNSVEKNILSYMLLDDSDKNQSYFKAFAKTHNLKFKKLKGRKISHKYDFWLFNSVSKWLYLIKHSEIVVTDSFHCTVFSIIFNKKFVVLANPERGVTRIENLLGLIGRKDRLYFDAYEVKEKVLKDDLDYEHINRVIEKEREASKSFLKKSLIG